MANNDINVKGTRVNYMTQIFPLISMFYGSTVLLIHKEVFFQCEFCYQWSPST